MLPGVPTHQERAEKRADRRWVKPACEQKYEQRGRAAEHQGKKETGPKRVPPAAEQPVQRTVARGRLRLEIVTDQIVREELRIGEAERPDHMLAGVILNHLP